MKSKTGIIANVISNGRIAFDRELKLSKQISEW